MSEREELSPDLAYFKRPEWAAIDRQEFLGFSRGFALPLVFESLEALSAAWYGLKREERQKFQEEPAYNEWAQVVNDIFELKSEWLEQVAAILGGIPKDPYGIWERPGELRLAKPYLRTDLINKESLINLAFLVRQVVNPEYWFPRFEPQSGGSSRLPFFVVLPTTGYLLPRQWQLGAKTYQLQMGRVLVPNPQICSEQEVATIFDVLADNYDDPTFADWEYKRLVFANMFFNALGSRNSGGRILDVGVGTGGFCEFLYQSCGQYDYEYWGFDLSGQMLRKAKGHFRNGGYPLVQSSAYSLPFASGYFDQVIASFVSHWLPAKESDPFAEVCRVIKPEGKFTFNVYLPPLGWTQQYTQRLERCGFSQVTCFSGELPSTLAEDNIETSFIVAEK